MGSGGGLVRAAWKAARMALFASVILAFAAVSATLTSAPRAHALDSEESTFLTLINNYRAQNGLAPLQASSQLNVVARWMADDMATNNYFSHTDSLGRDPFQRMDQLGYNYNTWRGENLVAGAAGAQQAFDLWKGSPGHNANMLSPNYVAIGIARSYNAASSFGWYWATEFGGVVGGSAPPPPPPPPPAPTPTPYVPPSPEPTPAPPPPPAPTKAPTPAPTPKPTPEPTPKPTPTPEPPHVDAPWWHVLANLRERLDTTGSSWAGAGDSADVTVRPGSQVPFYIW